MEMILCFVLVLPIILTAALMLYFDAVSTASIPPLHPKGGKTKKTVRHSSYLLYPLLKCGYIASHQPLKPSCAKTTMT
jgi:hypothetical protein